MMTLDESALAFCRECLGWPVAALITVDERPYAITDGRREFCHLELGDCMDAAAMWADDAIGSGGAIFLNYAAKSYHAAVYSSATDCHRAASADPRLALLEACVLAARGRAWAAGLLP